MKKFKFIIIILMGFSWLLPACLSHAAIESADALEASVDLDASVADEDPEQVPQWRSSLADIQRASGSLVQTNAKLTDEYDQVKRNLDQLQAAVDAQRSKNMVVEGEIERLRDSGKDVSNPEELAGLKGAIADSEQQIKAGQPALAALKLRRSSMDNRVALMRLRVAELSVAQKAREVDLKTQDQSKINALRAEGGRVRERMADMLEQARGLELKIAELGTVKTPFFAQVQDMARINAQLREQLDALMAPKMAQQVKLQEVEALRVREKADPGAARLHQLLLERQALEAQIKDNTAKLEMLKALKPEEVKDVAEDLKEQVQKLERQNTFIEEEKGNLRENIALLEYKLTTLGKYKNRNNVAGKK